MRQHLSGKNLIPLAIALVVVASLVASFVGKIVTALSCGGTWPAGGTSGPLAGLLFVFGRTPSESFGTADGCAASSAGVWVALACIAAVLITAGIWITMRVIAWRQSPAYLRREILGRQGVARAKEVDREMGPGTAVRRGAQVRSTLANERALEPRDVAWQLGISQGREVWVSMEDATLVLGPPRSGKGYRVLTAQIVEAPGAVVTTSSRGDNMEATILARSKIGPVYLFDPERVTGRATTIRWSPVRGCEDGALAKKRAQTLVSGTGLSSSGTNAEWAGKATDILQCLLHAAAVGNVPLSELHEWTKSPVAAFRALPILDERSPLGWGSMLRATLEEDDRTRANKWFGVSSSLSALDIPFVRECFEPAPGEDVFDPADFLARSGTLYLVAALQPSTGAATGVGVFFSMLLDDIQDTSHKMAMRSPGGRLDPPCAFILDEIANIHPWPGLPQAMAAGSGEGLQVTAVFQSRNQARDGWGDKGEGTIWESATRKIALGGGADPSDLRNLSDLLGVREERTHSESWQVGGDSSWQEQVKEKPVLSVDELRRLPEGNALLVAGRARPMLVDLIPHPERSWAAQVVESKEWHRDRPAVSGTQDAPTFMAGV